MGQHKYNLTAIAAARGGLTPKPPRKSRRQCDAEMRLAVLVAMEKHVPGTAAIMGMVGGSYYV